VRDEHWDDVADVSIATKRAAAAWRSVPIQQRLQVIRRFRVAIASDPLPLARMLPGWRSGPRPLAEVLTAEVLPLIEAARFLERSAAAILRPRRLGRRGRPVWLAGVESEIHYDPYGAVLVLAPGNYPLFLPAVQALQALAAGNGVCVKPAAGCAEPMRAVASRLAEAGLPRGLLTVLDDRVETGRRAIGAGFDKIVLTGSAETGRQVLRAAADHLIPCTMELSGDDPVFVLPEADLDLVAAAVGYGHALNEGRTCIAPKRVYAVGQTAEALRRMMPAQCPVPVIAVPTLEDALIAAAQSPYALGASVFGPEAAARRFARLVSCGCVVVNDVIVPTADPRLPFGGRRWSGFGVTRGAEGLRAMTVIKTIAVRRGRFRPHLDANPAFDAMFFAGLIRLLHGRASARFSGLTMVMRRAARAARG
jgi:acyl-CoA reductase-like NAD-dependent aldehyde dehydrogenase